MAVFEALAVLAVLMVLLALWKRGNIIGRVAMTFLSFYGVLFTLSELDVPALVAAIIGLIISISVWRAQPVEP